MLAPAALLARAQRDRRRERRHEPAVVEGHPPGVLQRLVVHVAGGDHRPAHRVEREVGPLVVAVRAVLPEVRQRGQHDTRIDRAQRLVAQTEALHRPRQEALDDRVGGRSEVERLRPTGLGLEIEHDAALVRVEEQEQPRPLQPRLVVVERRQQPRGVAARRLDLNDVGPVVGQQPGRERPGGELRQVDHGHVVERYRSGHQQAPRCCAARVLSGRVLRRRPGAALPARMLACGGAIGNASLRVWLVGVATLAHYGAAKPGVVGLMRPASAERA